VELRYTGGGGNQGGRGENPSKKVGGRKKKQYRVDKESKKGGKHCWGKSKIKEMELSEKAKKRGAQKKLKKGRKTRVGGKILAAKGGKVKETEQNEKGGGTGEEKNLGGLEQAF